MLISPELLDFGGLERLDSRPIPIATTEVRLFMKTRNEASRMLFFLTYYRQLGIDRFFVVDNGSTDRTVELLTSNPDCHVFVTNQNMALSRAGMNWIEPLLNAYGQNQWCLIVDADELLVYPNSETIRLAELCGKLDRRNENALPCILLDMYCEKDVQQIEYIKGQSFIEVCPFFDRSGFRYISVPDAENPMIIGGPRLRVFFPELLDWRMPARARSWILNKAAKLIGKAPYLKHSWILQKVKPLEAPHLNKVPLLRWNQQMALAPAAHFISGARLARGSGALLHFKFLGDFSRRVDEETARKAYAGDEYKRYHARTGQSTPLNFMCDLSTRFSNSQQLLQLGLLKELD